MPSPSLYFDYFHGKVYDKTHFSKVHNILRESAIFILGTLLGGMPVKFIGNYFVTFAQSIKH